MCACAMSVSMSGALLYSTLILLTTLVTTVQLISFTSVEEKNQFMNYEAKQRIQGNSYLIAEPKCEDELQQCHKLRDYCTRFRIVRKKCKDTCGLCRAHSPQLDCHRTPFGCCWDKKKPARGPNQEGCPACRDKYHQCRLFKSSCHMHNIMKLCPITCGIKCQTCSDDKHQAHVCPLYKSYGFCRKSPDIMQKICKKTCKFCL